MNMSLSAGSSPFKENHIEHDASQTCSTFDTIEDKALLSPEKHEYKCTRGSKSFMNITENDDEQNRQEFTALTNKKIVFNNISLTTEENAVNLPHINNDIHMIPEDAVNSNSQDPSPPIGSRIFNENSDHIDIQEETNDDEEDVDMDDDQTKELIKEMGHVKASMFLRHSMAFFLAYILMARSLLDLIDNVSGIEDIFVVLYGYLCYAFLEEVNFYYKYKTSDTDTKISYIYAGLDVFSLLCSVLILHLKFLKVLPVGDAAFLPGLVICALFYFSAYKRKGAKTIFLVKRFLEAGQIYLIEAKTEGKLDIPWKTLLAYMWFYVCIRILLLIISLKSSKAFLPANKKRANLLISLWHYSYIILLLTLLMITFGYSQAIEFNEDTGFLKKCLLYGQYSSGMLFCYTILTKPFLLMIFTRSSSMDYQSSEFGEEIVDPTSIGISRQIITEKKNLYYRMVSPTYYKPIKDELLRKLDLKKDGIKQTLLKFKLGRKLKSSYKDLKDFIQKPGNNIVTRRMVRKNVVDVIQSLSNTLNYKKASTENNNLKNGMSVLNKEKSDENYNIDLLNDHLLIKDRKSSDTYSELSLDDAINRCEESLLNTMGEKTNSASLVPLANLNKCYVCFEKSSDSIIKECGHGGVCFSCATKYILIKNQCMVCRGTAQTVMKILPEPVRDNNIFKVYMIGKLDLVFDDKRCHWLVE
jgi:hypothetical protein